MEVAPKNPIKGRMLAFSNNMSAGYDEDNNVIIFKSGILANYMFTITFSI